MIIKILEQNSQKKRYQDFVDSCEDIEDILLGSLTRVTLAVLQGQGQLIGPNELVQIGGNPESDPDAGVYLHIL